MIDEIRRQFELGWGLTELHLASLVEADFLWEPAELCWTVRPDSGGRWRADFAEVEPDPVPVPTIAWLTWHIDYWWSAALASMRARPLRAPSEVLWPGNGPAAAARLRTLAAQWREVLAAITVERLAEPAAFPWGIAENRTVADTVLWVTVELTKNAAEIGQLRLLRAARA
ncbi:DinB family protein [Mycolicibacterium austroafricanum]|uniref:DinB family protein n=1 Tax=Mycolicibacterium austroafricanum TaxID=39687 RepID=UPI001CA33F84|nr:DinB family protein [Mycolicibacterium austroafricanum]QZT54794.1 DinB family protein [Mycolicibacterium austroafricanum]